VGEGERRVWGAPLALLLVYACCAAGCAPAPPAGRANLASAPLAPAPPRPEPCRSVAPGTPLQPLLDAAAAGDAFCLERGVHDGPLRIERPLVLWGGPEAVIRSRGEGTTVRLQADGASLLGVTVDGSGGRFDLLDAAVHVQARDARVEGVSIRHASFGILVDRSERVALIGNDVAGDPAQSLGLRGDGIRLWETYDSRVERNRMHDSRDLVIWYSSRNHVADNVIERGRYGAHLMYSHDNVIEGNRLIGNVTGVFLMYSRGIELRGNLIAGSAGAAGIGLGLKESGEVRALDNDFVRNRVGIYVDSSPFQPGDHNRFERNRIRLCDTGVSFLSSESRNAFLDNTFADDAAAVRVEGGGNALGVEWRRNAFDDYAGYDLDGDGFGDLPYERRNLSGELAGRVPGLAFFRGTAALGLVETVGRVAPLFRPLTMLVDPEPRMAALASAPRRAD
jgi:nitrous oxidase accessory protein